MQILPHLTRAATLKQLSKSLMFKALYHISDCIKICYSVNKIVTQFSSRPDYLKRSHWEVGSSYDVNIEIDVPKISVLEPHIAIFRPIF